MAEANDKYGIIYQNLVDAGCNQKTIQCCMKLAQENNVEALLSQLCIAHLLSRHIRSAKMCNRQILFCGISERTEEFEKSCHDT